MWDNPKPLKWKKGEAMKELLFFVLGLVIGGLTGTTVMCILQINRLKKYDYENETE